MFECPLSRLSNYITHHAFHLSCFFLLSFAFFSHIVVSWICMECIYKLGRRGEQDVLYVIWVWARSAPFMIERYYYKYMYEKKKRAGIVCMWRYTFSRMFSKKRGHYTFSRMYHTKHVILQNSSKTVPDGSYRKNNAFSKMYWINKILKTFSKMYYFCGEYIENNSRTVS